jgi:DNA ligase-1
MRDFAALFAALDGTTRTSAKVAALADYFRAAPEADRVWTVALLSGRRPKRAVTARRLADWAAEAAGIPAWLFAECYAVAGDLAETIALVLPPPTRADDRTLAGWMEEIQGYGALDEPERRARVLAAWDRLGGAERFLYNKLLTGGFRMGVSQGLMTRALAEATGRPEAEIAHRLMGAWDPATTGWAALVAADPAADLSRPYPFMLAHPLEEPPAALGPAADWIAEWKWDGIRAQLVRRGDGLWLWSRGEELVTDRFPELASLAAALPPGTVLDGEIVAGAQDRPLPFASLQRRIGRKSVPRSVLAEAPARLLAYDLLEEDGADLRDRPFAERRARLARRLAALPDGAPLMLSPEVPMADWDSAAAARGVAREKGAEGLMLKRRAGPYLAGRRRGEWWKWKVDPFAIDAVLVYAQGGHGRRASLYTDYTFAVRDGDDLVPVAKAYSGLTDAEFEAVTRWVRANTLERFGPVRRVRPELVFEIGFEGIQPSARHRAGIALRFPRMLRWRRDKTPAEADTLETLRALLARYGAPSEA